MFALVLGKDFLHAPRDDEGAGSGDDCGFLVVETGVEVSW